MSNKCLGCKIAFCQKSCPLNNNISKINKYYQDGQLEESFNELLKTSVMPNILSNICFAKCQEGCIRTKQNMTVPIQNIEKEVVDYAKNNNIDFLQILKNNVIENINNEIRSRTDNLEFNIEDENIIKKLKDKNVKIVGSGPASISLAIYLLLANINVTIIDNKRKIGRLLRYGIPNFRLDKTEVDYLENILNKLNAKFEYKNLYDIDLKEITKNDIVVIATGLDGDYILDDKNYAISGKKFLVDLDNKKENSSVDFKTKSKIAVIGGGNVAIDTARTLKMLNNESDIFLIYRRQKQLMPADKEEIKLLENENINIVDQTDVESIEKLDDKYCLKLYKTKNSESRNSKLEKVEKSEYNFYADYIFNCIGSKISDDTKKHLKNNNIDVEKYIIVNKYKTTLKNCFAIGDIIGIDQNIASASNSGIKCSYEIISQILDI